MEKGIYKILDCVFLQSFPLAPCDAHQPEDKPPDWFTSYLESVSVLSCLGFIAAQLAQLECDSIQVAAATVAGEEWQLITSKLRATPGKDLAFVIRL